MRTNIMMMAAAFTLAGPAAQAVTYTVETVEYPGAVSSWVSAINDVGRVVGGYVAPGSTVATGFSERNGVYTSIPFNLPCRPNGRCHTDFVAINDWGLMAGRFSPDVDYPGAFVQQLGGAPMIVQPPGYPTTAVQIAGLNNQGVLAGNFVNLSATDPNRIFEVIGGTFGIISLPVANVTEAGVSGLNNWGQLVGDYSIADGSDHAFILTGRYLQELTMPAEWGRAVASPAAINDYGDVIGNYELPPAPDFPTVHGFMMSHGVWRKIEFPGAAETSVNAINNRGDVLGWFDVSIPGGQVGNQHTFLFRNGVYTDLGTVLPAGYTVSGMDNQGHLFGYYLDPNCTSNCLTTHGFVATPAAG